jgi:hypothetical protein
MGAPEGAFGGMGQVPAQVAATNEMALKIAQEEKDKEDLADVQKATAALSNYVTDAKYNEQTGVVTQTGEKAFGLPARTMESYQKYAGTLADGLRSDRQRMMFQRQVDANAEHLNNFVSNHTVTEREKYIAQQNDAVVQSYQDAGAKAGAAGDLEGMDFAAWQVESARRAFSEKKGIAPDVRDRMVAQDTSHLYTSAIMGMLDAKNDLQARQAFDQYKDKLTADDQKRLAGPLDLGSTLGAAQREIDRLFGPDGTQRKTYDSGNKVAFEYGPVKTMAEVIDETKSIKDAKVRAEVENLARRRFADLKLSEDQQNEAIFSLIYKRIEQHPGVDPKGLATPDEWENKLTDPKLRNDLRKLAFGERVTTPEMLTKLMSIPPVDLAKYSDDRMLTEFGTMANADYKQALERRDTARKGGDGYKSMLSDDEILLAGLRKIGLGGVKPDDTLEEIKKDKKKENALLKFKEQVDGARATLAKAGKKPDDIMTKDLVERAGFELSKKVKLVRRDPAFGVEAWADQAFGRKEVSVGQFLDTPELADQELEMPMDFASTLYSWAKSRPGTVAVGTDMNKFLDKNRGAVNRAFLAYTAGASEEQIRAAYLKGK